jgi:hypothetical protein
VSSLGRQKANVLYNKSKKANYASKPNNLQSFILKLGSKRDLDVTSNIAAAKDDVSPRIK